MSKICNYHVNISIARETKFSILETENRDINYNILSFRGHFIKHFINVIA